MEGAEIFEGDILVVDRSVWLRHEHIVLHSWMERAWSNVFIATRGGWFSLPKTQSIQRSRFGKAKSLRHGCVVGKFKRFGA